MKRRGKLFIISAPSGCGKTTLEKLLINKRIKLTLSISMTTRLPRNGEKEGRDYFFVTERKFKDIISKNGFLEWTKNFGFYYGTPKKFVVGRINKGEDVLLSIDVKGAINVKKIFKDAILIFILPPSIEILSKRLVRRMTDSRQDIKRRLSIAKKEISYLNRYDYKVVNDDLKKALEELRSVIIAERCKI